LYGCRGDLSVAVTSLEFQYIDISCSFRCPNLTLDSSYHIVHTDTISLPTTSFRIMFVGGEKNSDQVQCRPSNRNRIIIITSSEFCLLRPSLLPKSLFIPLLTSPRPSTLARLLPRYTEDGENFFLSPRSDERPWRSFRPSPGIACDIFPEAAMIEAIPF